MTTFQTHPDPRLDLTRHALRHTAEAWDDALGAAMDHDIRAARRVMRGGAARRSMLRTAHQRLQWGDSPRGLAVTRHTSPVDVVADLMHINRLFGQLSQTILAAPEQGVLEERARNDIDTARRIGAKRLWYFAEASRIWLRSRPAAERHPMCAWP